MGNILPDEGREELHASQRHLLWYILPIVLFPILMVVSAFLVVPSDWFVNRSGIPYLVNMAYAEGLQSHSCNVLIFGDSSAMVDVSPAIISEQTGLSACNIAEYKGMTAATRTLMVDEFLTKNPRPSFLIFMYSPDNLEAPSWKYTSFETITYLMRRQRNANTAKLLLLHPEPTLDWVEHGLRMALLRTRAAPFAADVHRQRVDTGGRFPNALPTRSGCDAELANVAPNRAWIDELRHRYGVGGTTVLVDATPTADCDPSLAFYRQHLQGFIDNWPYPALPADSFTGGGRLHANALGVERISMLLADQIKVELRVRNGGSSGGGADVPASRSSTSVRAQSGAYSSVFSSSGPDQISARTVRSSRGSSSEREQ
jgi:hypothetical protein